MFAIILDAFVLVGLMFVFDRKNPARDFIETGLVALVFTVAVLVMNWLLAPYLGPFVLVLYLALCVFLLMKITEIALPKAILIGTLFVAFKVFEPAIIRGILGG